MFLFLRLGKDSKKVAGFSKNLRRFGDDHFSSLKDVHFLEASVESSVLQLLLHDAAHQLSMAFPIIQLFVAADTFGRLANENTAIHPIALTGACAFDQRPFSSDEMGQQNENSGKTVEAKAALGD